jgi:hypothetical protein
MRRCQKSSSVGGEPYSSRRRSGHPAGPLLRSLHDEALKRLSDDDTDRPLETDIAIAERLITACLM